MTLANKARCLPEHNCKLANHDAGIREQSFEEVSPDFTFSHYDAMVTAKILPYEATPRAIRVFSNEHRGLSDYCYWFMLGTLWVSYTGWSDLKLWRRLFESTRPNRETSLMKPSELKEFSALPDELLLYRAHRPNETDWISYTLFPEKAAEFAVRRGVHEVTEYSMPKSQALCLFLRRGEYEVLSLLPATRVNTVSVITTDRNK